MGRTAPPRSTSSRSQATRGSPTANAAGSSIGNTRFFDAVTQSWQQVTMADPDRMREDEVVTGPALLVAVDTTVVVPSGYSARMTVGGYVVIELER